MVAKDYGSSPPDSANSLWYRSKTNWFEDDDGNIIYDLSEFFDTWQLDKWKKQKDYGMLQDKKGDLWEIFYEYYECCHHKCLECINRCEIFDLVRD